MNAMMLHTQHSTQRFVEIARTQILCRMKMKMQEPYNENAVLSGMNHASRYSK